MLILVYFSVYNTPNTVLYIINPLFCSYVFVLSTAFATVFDAFRNIAHSFAASWYIPKGICKATSDSDSEYRFVSVINCQVALHVSCSSTRREWKLLLLHIPFLFLIKFTSSLFLSILSSLSFSRQGFALQFRTYCEA